MKKILWILVGISILVSACEKNDAEPNTTSSIVAIGENSVILHSDDKGKTWTRATVPQNAIEFTTYSTSYKNDLSYAKYLNNRWWAVGGFASGAVHNASLLVSTDNGLSWDKVETPATSKLLYFNFHNGTYIAVGLNNIILSKDGATWEKVDLSELIDRYDGGKIYLKKVIYDGNDIIVTGTLMLTYSGYTSYHSIILESKDNGNSWTEVSGIGGEGIDDIQKVGNQILALSKGTVIRKQGNDWEYDNRSGLVRIYAPFIHNGDDFIVFSRTQATTKVAKGNYGNWEVIGNPIYNLGVSALMYGNGNYVFVGSQLPLDGSKLKACIYTSSDEGETWESARESIGDDLIGYYSNFRSGVFTQGNFIIAGDQARMPGTPTQIYTSEDGLTWTESLLPSLTIDEHITLIVAGKK